MFWLYFDIMQLCAHFTFETDPIVEQSKQKTTNLFFGNKNTLDLNENYHRKGNVDDFWILKFTIIIIQNTVLYSFIIIFDQLGEKTFPVKSLNSRPWA